MADSLKPRQARAIAALMVAGSITEAATLANVPRRTLTTWLQTEPFRAELRKAQDEAVSTARRIMAGASIDAAEFLAGQLRGIAPLDIKMQAARELLRHVTALDTAARIEAIQDVIDSAKD